MAINKEAYDHELRNALLVHQYHCKVASKHCGYAAESRRRMWDAVDDIDHNQSLQLSDSRVMALQIAWAYLGRPYVWGGDDPVAGFDCSGFIIEILKSVGVLPRSGDWTAQSLATKLSNHKVSSPSLGTLVFWENSSGRIIHVEICMDAHLAIGASGGGSRTLTTQDAINQNAYIKIRPWATRSGAKLFIDPFTRNPLDPEPETGD